MVAPQADISGAAIIAALFGQQYYDVYFLDYHLVGLNAARLTEAAILHI